MDFKGIRIAGARVHADLTMAEAAKRLGISKNTLYKWENDESKIPTYAVSAISDLYQIPKALLLCAEDEPTVYSKEA